MSPASWLRRLALHRHGDRGAPGSSGQAPHRSRAARRGQSSVADDCAAFLTGSLVRYRLDHGEGVAPWEWTNLLAHGSEAALRDELAAEHHQRPDAPERDDLATWQAARSYVVVELLDLAGTCGPLAELQRSLLVPLELELAGRPDTDGWRPNQWLAAVEAALGAQRLRARRRAPRSPDASETPHGGGR